MMWFGYDYPAVDFDYYYQSRQHIISTKHTSLTLTPELYSIKKPIIVLGRTIVGKGLPNKRDLSSEAGAPSGKPVLEVYFYKNSFKLTRKEKKKFKNLSPYSRYYLVGGSCWVGPEKWNLTLSGLRVYAVKEYMEKLGLRVVGYKAVGESFCREKSGEVLWKCRKVQVFLY